MANATGEGQVVDLESGLARLLVDLEDGWDGVGSTDSIVPEDFSLASESHPGAGVFDGHDAILWRAELPDLEADVAGERGERMEETFFSVWLGLAPDVDATVHSESGCGGF